MFISITYWYALVTVIVLGFILNGHGLYLIQMERGSRKGVTTTAIGKAVFNFLIAMFLNGLIVYLIYKKKRIGV